MTNILQTAFSISFCCMKFAVFDFNFTEMGKNLVCIYDGACFRHGTSNALILTTYSHPAQVSVVMYFSLFPIKSYFELCFLPVLIMIIWRYYLSVLIKLSQAGMPGTFRLFNSLRPSDAYMHRQLTIIGSDNGLLPGRRQAIIWTNAGILLIGPLRTNFSEIAIAIEIFSFKKKHLKMSSGQWQPSCLGLNVLTDGGWLTPYGIIDWVQNYLS